MTIRGIAQRPATQSMAPHPVLHSAPRLARVLAEQVRTFGFSFWKSAVAVAILVAIATVLMVTGALGTVGTIGFFPHESLLPALLGVLLPIGVWRSEQAFGSGFLWTMPVDRRMHALTRVTAGWIWLMIAVAGCMLWLLGMTMYSGGSILAPRTLHLIPSSLIPSPGTIQPGAWTDTLWTPTPLLWLVPFSAATGTYVFASALALGSRYPLRWIVGVASGLFVLLAVGEATSVHWLEFMPEWLFRPLLLDRYGLDSLLTAQTEFLKVGTTLSNGEPALLWRGLPNVGDWAVAAALWNGVALIALWAAASRHRERRRS